MLRDGNVSTESGQVHVRYLNRIGFKGTTTDVNNA
jgi:hypothetical protein